MVDALSIIIQMNIQKNVWSNFIQLYQIAHSTVELKLVRQGDSATVLPSFGYEQSISSVCTTVLDTFFLLL